MSKADEGELCARKGRVVEVAKEVVIVMFGSSNECCGTGVCVDLCQGKLVFDGKNDIAMNFRCRKCARGCFELDLDGQSVDGLRSGITRFGGEIFSC